MRTTAKDILVPQNSDHDGSIDDEDNIGHVYRQFN